MPLKTMVTISAMDDIEKVDNTATMRHSVGLANKKLHNKYKSPDGNMHKFDDNVFDLSNDKC